MKCKHPFMRDPTGKVRWSVKMTKEEKVDCLPFPCGICLHCKINKRRVLTHRMLLEQRASKDSCFVTLTYNEEHIPENRELKKRDLQNYFKRLRHVTEDFRYYAVGEYGAKWRPHYHIAFFNLGVKDTQVIISKWGKNTESQCPTIIGDLNKDSASYIAGYVVKKLTNKKDKRLKGLSPEFSLSSKKNGGIGYPYIKMLSEKINNFKYKEDKVIQTLYRQGKPYPLGGYLTRKLSELTNVSEQTLNKHFDDYCESIYGNALDAEQSYWSQHFKDEEKMLSQEKKYAILQQTRGRTL